jgi:hypothetical protein
MRYSNTRDDEQEWAIFFFIFVAFVAGNSKVINYER